MKILSVVGARPNFMKVAPLHRVFSTQPGFVSKIVHTGQHYDARMSEVFFQQLEMPQPDHYLGVGGGSHTQQTAKIMLAFEEVLSTEQPDWVLVAGDVNSSIACALVAAKAQVPVAHVEAGLRSGDRQMPEEINRILTDAISDLLFVTEQSGLEHLATEGISGDKVHFVGNCMIDSLVHFQPKATATRAAERLGLSPKTFALMTMHRPSNVDTPMGLEAVLRLIELLSPLLTVVFPIHPRTRQNVEKFGLEIRLSSQKNLVLLEPQGYLEFLNLMENAALVLTDSGGVQEETTFLRVPCLTFRNSTERPATVALGSNELLEHLNPETAREQAEKILEGRWKTGSIPPLWDGRAAERIAAHFVQIFNRRG